MQLNSPYRMLCFVFSIVFSAHFILYSIQPYLPRLLEKFELLEETFNTKDAKIDAQRTIFWLGRNYFSLLLEPTLAKYEPVEELRIDRLLDRMLYRLEEKN